jgi:excisionase family DNA binding protein
MNSCITSIEEIPMVVTPAQMADILQVSKPTVYRIIRDDEIPTVTISSKMLIYKADFVHWLNDKFKVTK